ncbi:MAG: hypothetical protein QW290_09165 [Sulfolobales archaeon]
MNELRTVDLGEYVRVHLDLQRASKTCSPSIYPRKYMRVLRTRTPSGHHREDV